MPTDLDLSPELLRKVAALGPVGHRWVEDLGAVVATLEEEWQLKTGASIFGGSAGYVCRATTADGVAAVLKLAMPDGLTGNGEFARELEAVQRGQGHGYVALLRADAPRRAMLQEALGRPLEALGLPAEAQLDVISATLGKGWQPAADLTGWRTGAEQARFLHDFTASTWEELGRPASEEVVLVAQRFAQARLDGLLSAPDVLIHGDAHPGNVLEDPTVPGAFKLIDPDAMASEPAHDLAIPLREWNQELVGDDPARRLLAWCERAAAPDSVDPRAIWEWAFMERVSTGLFLLQLGDPKGRDFLAIAETLVRA